MRCFIFLLSFLLSVVGSAVAQEHSFELPPSQLITQSVNESWSDYNRLSLTVSLVAAREIEGAEFPKAQDIYASFFYQSKQGFWSESRACRIVRVGQHIQFDFDLSSASSDWKMAQARRLWGRDTLEWVRSWGVKLFSRSHWQGRVRLSQLSLQRAVTESDPTTARVLDSGDLPFGARYVDFEAPAAEALNLALHNGDASYLRPAFYFQPYSRAVNPWSLELRELQPRGRPRWRAIFTDVAPGSYQLRLFGARDEPYDLGSLSIADHSGVKAQLTAAPRGEGAALRKLSRDEIWEYNPRDPSRQRIVARDASAQAWYLPIEWSSAWGRYLGAGSYDHHLAAEFEEEFARASERGEKFPVLMLAEFELNNSTVYNWVDNPLRDILRGSAGAGALFDDPQALALLQKRWRYIYARYSHYPAFGGVVLDLPRLHPRYGRWIESFFRDIYALDNDILCYTSYQGYSHFTSSTPLAWTAASWEGRLSSTGAVRRGRGLTISGEFPGVVAAALRGKWHMNANSYLSLDIEATENLPPHSKLRFLLRTARDRLFQSPLIEVASGELRRLRLPLDNSWSLAATGESMTAPYELLNVEEIVLQLFCDRDGSGGVRVSNTRLEGRNLEFDRAPEPLAIENFKRINQTRAAHEKHEFSFDINHVFANPYNPDEVMADLKIIGPDGLRLSLPAFYFEERAIDLVDGVEKLSRPAAARGQWRLRFTPPRPGLYTYELVVKTAEQEARFAGKFTAATNSQEQRGVIAISSSDQRYFEFANGELFYPIGLNLRSPTDRRPGAFSKELAGHLDRAEAMGVFIFEEWFGKMREQGMNFARLWMSPWWCGIEWDSSRPGYHGVGYYNQDNAARLDRLLELAEQNGIYLNLETSHHGSLSVKTDRDWDNNPYNRDLSGGMFDDPVDYMRDEQARALHKRRLRYCAARWGYSKSIAFWGVMTEAEFTKAYEEKRKTLVREWLVDMTTYLKEVDAHGHLVTAHFSNPWNGREVWDDENIPIINTNAYTIFMQWATWYSKRRANPRGVVGALLCFRNDLGTPDKPAVLSEWGGHPVKNRLSHLRAEFHTGMWAQAILDLPGNTGFWWWNLVDADNSFKQYAAVARFSAEQELRGKNYTITFPRPKERVMEPERKLIYSARYRSLVRVAADECWGYVYHRNMSHNTNATPATAMVDGSYEMVSGLLLSLPKDLEFGSYNVEFWDTYRGEIVGRAGYEHGENSILSLPPFGSDIAFKLRAAEVVPAASQASASTESTPL